MPGPRRNAPSLPLDSGEWETLQSRSGGSGWVSEWLTRLMTDPEDAELFSDRWPELCSEDTAWPAAIAAFPHLVEAAARLPAGSRIECKQHDERDLRYLMCGLAALHGEYELAACIDQLDDEDTCPEYAEHVWGTES